MEVTQCHRLRVGNRHVPRERVREPRVEPSGEYDGAPVQFSDGVPPSTRLRATLSAAGTMASAARGVLPASTASW